MISPKKYNLALLGQLVRFSGVGLTALVIHWSAVLLIVPLGYPPLMANIIAFCIAFQFSFWGHRYWTFKAQSLPKQTTRLRYLIVALGGFVLNQSLFWFLLEFTNLPYQLALFLVLLLVSVNSFIFSKFWAFRV